MTICALIGASFYPTTSATQSAPSSQAAAILDEKIGAHVKYLASEKLGGRRTGTEGAELAARYIADEFRRAGLKPASSNGFLIPFDFISGVKLGKQNSLSIKTGSESREVKIEHEYMPLAFSSSTPAQGQIVFVGFGIGAPELQHDDYAAVDVKGKIAMILRSSPDGDNPHGRFADFTAPGMEIQRKTLKAREKGATGVIFVSAETNFKQDNLTRLRHDLNFLDGGIAAAVISRTTADSILKSSGTSLVEAESRAKSTGSFVLNAMASLRAEIVRIPGKDSNVAGILPGSDPTLSSEYIIIGAHYDHLGLGGPESLAAKPDGSIHYGADDNASGTSCLIEIARVLAAHRPAPKRSVVFIAFSGEELGLLGSAAFAKNPPSPLTNAVAMLNMDMVGRLRDRALFVGGVGTSPVWQPLLDRLNSDGSSPHGGSGGTKFKISTGQDGFGASDHQSFYVRDVPVLFFFTGTHDDYHKPSDTAEKVNSEGAARISEFVRDIAVAVANEPQRIAFNRVKVESRPTGRGFRVYLGTVPNYSDQAEGMKLDGVRPGSPAEKAGLLAGDFVIKLAGVQIKNVYDYTYALGEMQPGVEIDVLIKRNGKEMNLKLVPDKRQ